MSIIQIRISVLRVLQCNMPSYFRTCVFSEILRFIENGYKVQYIEVDSETVAVDTHNDLKKVNEIMSAKLKKQ